MKRILLAAFALQVCALAEEGAIPASTILATPRKASAQSWVKLGNSLMQKARNTLKEDFAPASAAFEKALSLEPENIEAIVGMAWVKNSQHDFTAGRRYADRALALDPHQADARSLIGDGAVELGNYDEAFDHYQAALESRTDLSTLSRAAHLLWLTGDAAQAREFMQRAAEAGGPHLENAAWCRSELALMEFQSGAMSSAEQNAAAAVEAAPGNPRVLATMARILAAKRDYPQAIALYEKSAAITPNHEALAALVDLYHLTGAEEKAEERFWKVVVFHQQYPHPNSAQLARFYADHDREIETALKEARGAYEVYKNVGAADTLAWCLLKSGRPQEAKEMLLRAMQWKTPYPEMHFHAGMIELALKNPDAAKRHFEKALAMNPNFHPIHASTAAGYLKN